MSKYRRKQASKRRWVARWKLGREIPAIALAEHKGLAARLQPSHYLLNRDAIVRAA